MIDPKNLEIKSPKSTPLTTKKEIWAWWLYMVAIEPVSIVILQLFLPLVLEALPRIVGHVAGSPNIPCSGAEGEVCVLYEVGGFRFTGSAFSYTIITLSVLLQAFVFVLFGALADYGSMRRKFLASSTCFGAAFCIAILGVGKYSFAPILAGLLDISIMISFGVSLMLYNSYLPLLSENHVEVVNYKTDDPTKMTQRREEVSSSLSTKSFMMGYGSAILVLILCAGYMFLTDGGFSQLKHAIAFTGGLWLLLSIYPLLTLRTRPGPPLPEGSFILTFSLVKTAKTISKHKNLPHTFRYLLAYFLFADGCNTIGQVAVLFVRDVLKAPYETLIICAILAPFSGVIGAYFFFFLQKKFKISSKSMLMATLCGLIGLTMYGGFGVFQNAFGMHHIWEAYMIAVIYGFLIGAMQSFSRVLYSEMIPPGEESEFFSLYAITDKGSSWIGPAVQALVTLLLPDQRYGFFFLGLMILLPFPILIWGVDPTKGKQDATAFSATIANENRHMLEK